MEVIGFLFLALIVVITLKLFSFFLNVTIFAIALPFKILGLLFGALVFGLVCVPLGIFAGLTALLFVPLILLFEILPFLLILVGLYFLIKHSSRPSEH